MEGTMAKLTNFNVPYAQIPNSLLNDPDLSLKAKGLWAYMQAKPSGWDFSADRIAREIHEGRDSVLTTFRELITKGYMSRAKKSDGYVRYELLLPKSGKPHHGETPSRENPPVNKEIQFKKKLDIKKKEDKQVERQAFNRIHELAIELFDKTTQYKLSDARKKLLQARLKDAGEPMMVNALKALASSPFHRGDNERGWKADPYWVFKSYEQTERFAEAFEESGVNHKSLQEIKI
jgi:hypothetical protein